MKRKTRLIYVEGQAYEYVISEVYRNKQSLMTVKLFLQGSKLMPYIIKFCTWDDPISGSPLNAGVQLKNEETQEFEVVNLHRPKLIRRLIVHAVQSGWTGTQTVEAVHGLALLKQWGYAADWLAPGEPGPNSRQGESLDGRNEKLF